MVGINEFAKRYVSEFEQLLPFMWRGLHLPLTRIHLTLAHDHVEHKYMGVNGGRIENTGVAPVRVEASIPIGNHIFPGKKEKWAAGALYPDLLRKFIVAFGDRRAGLLQHPELGEIACKPDHMDFELTGDRRDSTEIRASWIETLDDAVVSKIVSSPVQEIELSASDLAASGVDLSALVPQLPKFKEDLASLGRKLTAIVDQVGLAAHRQASIANQILYQAHRMTQAIERARSALTWPATEHLEKVKSAAHEIRKNALSREGVGFYLVPAATTLAGVATSLPKGTSMNDVIRLNPELIRKPVVDRGSLIRYPIAA